MSVHDRHISPPPAGGAAIGHLEEMPRIEAAIVCYLRMWCSGEDGHSELALAFYDAGAADVDELMEQFSRLMRGLIDAARRPLQRRHMGCALVSGDESAFAHFVAAAAVGEREDAMLLASLLVLPQAWLPMTMLAEEVGLDLARLHAAAPNYTHQPQQNPRKLN